MKAHSWIKQTLAKVLTKVLTTILTLELALAPAAHALRIQLNDDLKLRANRDQQMERVGLLTKGSIVEIPDEFALPDRKHPNFELTLNNWLRVASAQAASPGLYRFDGELRDYFFPVRIVHAAPGSTLVKGEDPNHVFVALKFLVRKGNALALSENAPINAPINAPMIKPTQSLNDRSKTKTKLDTDTDTEGDSPCAKGLCSAPSDASQPVRNLISSLAPALHAAATRSGQVFNRSLADQKIIESTFRQSCGFGLNEFTAFVRQRAQQEGIPTEILLALMTQESSGRCYVLNSESDRTQSVGLFQINSSHARFPRCSTAEKNQLMNVRAIGQLATAPRCLENPLVNLDEAIHILKQKAAALTASSARAMTGPVAGFDAKKLKAPDLWRMVASAYNGGEGWVLQAKADLELFNAKQGTQLDPHNWEDLRLFYMRRWLNRDVEQSSFGSVRTARSETNSIHNLAYAENIVARDVTRNALPGLVQMWSIPKREK